MMATSDDHLDFLVMFRTVKCSLDAAKRGFYRAFNSIFGKIGHIASEEVILQLASTKCIPILLYGLEVLPIRQSQLRSLDFMINRFFMKFQNQWHSPSSTYAKTCFIFICQVSVYSNDQKNSWIKQSKFVHR